MLAAALVLVGALARADGPSGPAPVRAPLVPADLGATSIDVAAYPEEYQRTYRDLFLGKCGICHTPARALWAPYLEVSAAEAAEHKRRHPDATWNEEILDAGPNAWRKYIVKMWRRPPCCNLCPTFTRAEAEKIWKFLVYDSIQRKGGDRAEAWAAARKDLITRFHTLKSNEEGATP